MSLEMPHLCLQGWASWVCKPAYLATDPLTIQEGWQEIAQAITKCQIKVRGPGHPCMNPLTPQPFRFDRWGDLPQRDIPRDANSDHKLSPQRPPRGQNHDRHRNTQGLLPSQPPLPSPDCRFESDRSSVSTALSMSSLSDQSEGSWHPQRGRWRGEAGAYMKINLPKAKDVGFDGIPLCRMLRLHTPPICHLVLARLPQRVSAELWDGYNLGWCVNDLGWTL